MKQVVVIIPIYKPAPDEFERISLDRTAAALSARDVVVIHPEGLDTAFLRERYPRFGFHAFSSDYFRGIMGYNRLMLSEDFYAAFADYEYLLICQPDAYIFRDDLDAWCSAGYDYVGAPWLRKPVYNLPLVKQYMDFSHRRSRRLGRKSKQDLYGKIGNGGFSLRRISSHLEALRRHGATVSLYLDRDRKDHHFNEDVFWATEPEGFRYPPVGEALKFSFDKYPALCYRLAGRRLPMGCHAWWKRKMRRFWQTRCPEMFPDAGG